MTGRAALPQRHGTLGQQLRKTRSDRFTPSGRRTLQAEQPAIVVALDRCIVESCLERLERTDRINQSVRFGYDAIPDLAMLCALAVAASVAGWNGSSIVFNSPEAKLRRSTP